MNYSAFIKLQHSINLLNYLELKRLKHYVDAQISKDQITQIFAEHEDQVHQCPHCQNEHFSLWGYTRQGRQRYRCKNCFRTFSTTTGTSLYRLKLADKWLNYAEHLWFSKSLRYVAHMLDINVKTAFKWRHRFLKNPAIRKPSELCGIVEADETFIPESFKGKKQIPRAPRKRGGDHVPLVPIFIALDRNGAVTHQVLKHNTKKELGDALGPLLKPDSALCTDGNLSYCTIVKSLKFNLDHKRLLASENQVTIDKIYHIQTVNNFIMRWKRWMVRFYGVGTAYLEHYLAWFCFMEKHQNEDARVWLDEAF